MSRVSLWTLLGIAIVAICTAPAARADVFNLNVDFCTLSCLGGVGNVGGTVTLTLGTGSNGITAGNVRFDVNLAAPAGVQLNFHQTNGLDAFMFNYAGTATLSFSGLTTNYNQPLGPGSYHEDGAGSFEYIIKYYTQPAVDGTSLTFTVHGTDSSGAAVPLALSDFETRNSDASLVDFAANVSNGACTGLIGAGNGTGVSTAAFYGTGPCSGAVPEPTSIVLFGSSLLLAGFLVRKRLAVRQ